jgi:hypothetical protein
MLQGAAAALAEMPAYRLGPGRGGNPLDHPALPPGAAPRANLGADPIAGDGKRQEHGLAAPVGDPIALRAEPVDGELDQLTSGRSLRSPLHCSEIR